MMAALIILSVVYVVMLVVLLAFFHNTVRGFNAERAGWHAERTTLVNRIIAKSTSEVIHLDRNSNGKQTEPQQDRQHTPNIPAGL